MTPTLLLVLVAAPSAAANPEPPVATKSKRTDARLTRVRTVNDKDFFFQVPPTRAAWEARRKALRQQVLVAAGLWPRPEKMPLDPVIHGKIDRDGYTIEKVFFRSLPGHYVSGNLYRPRGRTGKLPAVLSPHGHWPRGRFQEQDEKRVQAELQAGGEKTAAGARYPLQARCAGLARMGCVVFLYDMVGFADSQAVPHRTGFADTEAVLHLQGLVGLQTWNSIRAFDFLVSLPDVDPKRVGVTGASGGGTQTFLLCAVDDRPAVAFPAVMVSTQMQGDCYCESTSYLRQGTGNIELAGLFAPRPLGMTGANDWTIDIETKGLPELKALYKLYGAEDRVMATCFPHFDHNYNQVSREVMYNWFNVHLGLGLPKPVTEKPFVPVPPKDLTVWTPAHPVPRDAVDIVRLRQHLTEASDRQINALIPKDRASLTAYRRVIGTALRVMIGDQLPAAAEVLREAAPPRERDGVVWRPLRLGRKGQDEAIPALFVTRPGPDGFNGIVIVWVHPAGKASLLQDGNLVPAARKILDRKAAILAPDLFGTGDLKPEKPLVVSKSFPGLTFCYNRPLLANRVHDLLTVIGSLRGSEPDTARSVHLVGFHEAGPWVVLARGLCGDAVIRTAADLNGFRFELVKTANDSMMLPGALKYGGLGALGALATPSELFIHNTKGTGVDRWLRPVYQAENAAEKLHRSETMVAAGEVIDWLLR
jgi:dienelactone hydrolase